MLRLDGKVAVVTGGARGIGFAAAKRFVENGAKVLLVDLELEALNKAAKEIGGAIACFAGNVGDEATTKAFIEEAVNKFGKIDIMFANAGIEGEVAPITDYSIEAFDNVIAVNLRGAFLSVKHAMGAMGKTGGGSIIITSSVAGLKGFANLSAYVISKHAVIGLMRTAAIEGAANGVRVNSIHPGPIETQMMRSIEHQISPKDESVAKGAFTAEIPFKRYGEASEVADLALFLASDESRYITGSMHVIDGGMLL